MRASLVCVRNSLLLLLPLAFVGCSSRADDSPPAVPVKGKVVRNGSGVKHVMVFFMKGDGAEVASGETNANGEFQLSTYDENDGAPAGEYKVTIQPGSAEEGAEGEDVSTPEYLQKYSEPNATPLTATVTEAGPNEFTFELD